MGRKKLSPEEKQERKETKDLAKSVYYDHPEMHTGQTTREQKVSAAVAYLMGNSLTRSAKIAGVTKPTIFDWKYRSSWWGDLLTHLKTYHDADLEARTTGVINKTLGEIEDRIEKGDEVVTKDGDTVRKRVGARDMAIIFGTLYDKRQLMRSQPTSISESSTESDRLKRLREQFEDLAEKKVNAFEGQYTRVDTDDHIDGEFRESTNTGETNGEQYEPVRETEEPPQGDGQGRSDRREGDGDARDEEEQAEGAEAHEAEERK